MLAVFVIVLGFVTAAVIATASAAYQNSDGSIELSMGTTMGLIKGFLLCMFVGPYIITKNSMILFVQNKIGFAIFGICILIAVAWSFCLGIVSIQTLVGIGLV